MSCMRQTCPFRLEHVSIAFWAFAAGFISDMQTSPFGVCPPRRPDGHTGLAPSARSPALQHAKGAPTRWSTGFPSMLGPHMSVSVLKYLLSMVPWVKPRSPIQSKNSRYQD
eukprot:scaffold1377_cov220-Pinguiococcus_pyrenoidosus.AAC.7